MKKLLILIAAVGISLSAAAQNYNYGIGLRLGYHPSIDFKWNYSERNSWQFDLNFPAFDGASVTAAYQWNWPLGTQRFNGGGFNAYIGPAIGLGVWGFRHSGFLFGVGAHGGIEYKFDIPLAVAFEYKPMFNFVARRNGVLADGFYDFAIAIRYAF